jgi:hypothetical protein
MCAKQASINIKIEPILPKPQDFPVHLDKKIKAAVKDVLLGPVKTQLQGAQQKRIKYWQTKPTFTGQYRVMGDNLVLLMTLSGSDKAKSRWRWVSLGTNRKGRHVTAVRAGAMVFKRYKAKTGPNNVYGTAGNPRRYGEKMVFVKPKRIKMSSIKARHFEDHIVKEEKKEITNKVIKAIQRALKD